jgi:Arm DNA-binding domain
MKGGTRKRGTTWTWHLGVLDPATGRWRQLSKGGFPTKREAQAALNEAKAALRAGIYVAPSRLTLGAFLTGQWLPTARAVVRPTTWTTYRIYAEAQVIRRWAMFRCRRLRPRTSTASTPTLQSMAAGTEISSKSVGEPLA